jgi:UMF1 family MFS transporter
MDLNHHDAGHRGVPQYAGEDTRLTSSKELAGWYSYGWAVEVFVVCAMGEWCLWTEQAQA